jgi:UDP-N-acetylglucosamine/UDP-N-acetyl-alpha-D-glucosaminouronate 4-epimerase
MIHQRLLPDYPYLKKVKPIYENFRQGDVRHSEADISKATKLLGFQPTHSVEEGLDAALDWYKKDAVR